MYQTLEDGPRESAKPVTFDSFQVAFAPGAPGALPWARAGPAAAMVLPATRASAADNLAPWRAHRAAALDVAFVLIMSPPRAAAGRAGRAPGSRRGKWVYCTT